MFDLVTCGMHDRSSYETLNYLPFVWTCSMGVTDDVVACEMLNVLHLMQGLYENVHWIQQKQMRKFKDLLRLIFIQIYQNESHFFLITLSTIPV